MLPRLVVGADDPVVDLLDLLGVAACQDGLQDVGVVVRAVESREEGVFVGVHELVNPLGVVPEARVPAVVLENEEPVLGEDLAVVHHNPVVV